MNIKKLGMMLFSALVIISLTGASAFACPCTGDDSPCTCPSGCSDCGCSGK